MKSNSTPILPNNSFQNLPIYQGYLFTNYLAFFSILYLLLSSFQFVCPLPSYLNFSFELQILNPEGKLKRVLLLIQQYLPQIENVSLVDRTTNANSKNDLFNVDVKPSMMDLACILGFKKLRKITNNINKFYGILKYFLENVIQNSVKEIEVINGHAILEEGFIDVFEASTAFPCLEKLVIDPFDYYERKLGKSFLKYIYHLT